MKLDNLKYGFLISMTTMFGGSMLELHAQDTQGKTEKIENSDDYKRLFQENVTPEMDKLSVEFVVDSVAQRPSNGDLLADVNVIQLLAYIDQDSDEYQSYMASRHIVAHEMWHRICMMNEVLEKPMSASHFRNGRDNFEISANIVQLLTFREDYIQATPEQRKELRKLDDPKIRMYVMAVEHGLVRPLSNDKKDFDFEMEFIAKTVSGFWNNNMAQTYAARHNAMTEKAGRKEFKSPVYEKNFTRDIKMMNTIGGIDFSKFYNVRDVRNRKEFASGYSEDTIVYKQSLTAPDYETWVDKKSQLKRFSRQKIEIPNFTGNRLAEERRSRPKEERVQPYRVNPLAQGVKIYPFLKVPFYAAAELQSKERVVRLYPNGSLDVIGKENAEKTATVKSFNYDGSYETGLLKSGRKHGEFVYYDDNKKEIARCRFANGRAVDGEMILAMDGQFIAYRYHDGKLLSIDRLTKSGKRETICRTDGGNEVSGLVPVMEKSGGKASYLIYQNGELLAGVSYRRDGKYPDERQSVAGNTLKIERFYRNGLLKYKALAAEKTAPQDRQPVLAKQKTAVTGEAELMRFADERIQIFANGEEGTQKTKATDKPLLINKETLYSPEGLPVMATAYHNGRRSIRLKAKEFLSLLGRFSVPTADKNILRQAVTALNIRKKDAQTQARISPAPAPRGKVGVQAYAAAASKPNSNRISILKNRAKFILLRGKNIEKS